VSRGPSRSKVECTVIGTTERPRARDAATNGDARFAA
jgi:hypothetical protein